MKKGFKCNYSLTLCFGNVQYLQGEHKITWVYQIQSDIRTNILQFPNMVFMNSNSYDGKNSNDEKIDCLERTIGDLKEDYKF